MLFSGHPECRLIHETFIQVLKLQHKTFFLFSKAQQDTHTLPAPHVHFTDYPGNQQTNNLILLTLRAAAQNSESNIQVLERHLLHAALQNLWLSQRVYRGNSSLSSCMRTSTACCAVSFPNISFGANCNAKTQLVLFCMQFKAQQTFIRQTCSVYSKPKFCRNI